MATKVGMYSATHKNVLLPVGREIGKYGPRKQIAGFVTVPYEKKKTHMLPTSEMMRIKP